MLADRKTPCIFEYIGLAVILSVFALTAWGNIGWDDEIANMRIIEAGRSLPELVRYMSTWDVHPAGQYVICSILYWLLGSWRAVRVFGALLVSLSLWLYWRMTAKNRPFHNSLFSFVFLCLNPSMLLWCTSVHWYTWIVPPMCLLGVILHKAGDPLTKRGRLIFWVSYYSVCVILFHIAYSSIIAILASFICILWERRKFLRNELRSIVWFALLSAILISYQAYALLTVHYWSGRNALLSKTSMLKCLTYAGQNFLCGSATIPVSPAGIMLLLGGLVMFCAFVLNMKVVLRHCHDKFLALSYTMNILLKTGLGARYYTYLHPSMGDFMSDSYSFIASRKVKISVLVLYFAGSIWGIVNVMTHNDSAKAGWNTPYDAIIRRIDEIDPTRKALIITPNSTLAYHLEKSGHRAIDIHAHELPDLSEPTIAVNTYGGSIEKSKYKEFVRLIETGKTAPSEKIGRDKYAWFKQKIDPAYPDYYAEIFIIGL